jgi:hypothetical protein
MVIQLKARHRTVSSPRRVLSGYYGLSHQPCYVNTAINHRIQKVLTTYHVTMSFELA